MSIRALTEADAACGAKAIGLAKLIAAGLRVPEGFVIDRGAFDEVAALAQVAPEAVGHALADAERRLASAELPDALVREVLARAAALGRLAVRSSASVEDGELGSAAGVFSSLTDVAPEAVWEAVRAVWISALLPLAVSYARRHHAEIAIAVIIQRFVPGERMTVYTRPAGEPASDELWLSRGGAIERVPRSLADARPEAAIALAAEAAIGAARGADVELVLEPTPHGARVWIVQARPIVRPIARHRQPAPPMVVAALVQDGRRWTWDITHNPDPLSPAQAGLVEQVDRAAASPYALRVCGGYLYMTAGAPREPVAAPADRVELAARIAAIEGRLELGPAESPAAAVARAVAFMRIWAGELSPLVSAARRRLLDRLAQQGHPAERIPALVAALVGPRRVPRDRVMAPAWDVAVPTFAELAATTDAGDARDAALARAATRPKPTICGSREHNGWSAVRCSIAARRCSSAKATSSGCRSRKWSPAARSIQTTPTAERQRRAPRTSVRQDGTCRSWSIARSCPASFLHRSSSRCAAWAWGHGSWAAWSASPRSPRCRRSGAATSWWRVP